MGLLQSKPKVNSKDKAILELKVQRDKLKQYEKKVVSIDKLQVVIERELQIAKQQLALKNHHAARLALSKKKYQEQLLEKTGNQLMTIEQLCGTIEYAIVEQEILQRLDQGTKVLNQIHNEMSLEKVEKIMEDTQDAIEYQNEIQEIISREFSPEDEEDIMAQLDDLIEQEVFNVNYRRAKNWETFQLYHKLLNCQTDLISYQVFLLPILLLLNQSGVFFID